MRRRGSIRMPGEKRVNEEVILNFFGTQGSMRMETQDSSRMVTQGSTRIRRNSFTSPSVEDLKSHRRNSFNQVVAALNRASPQQTQEKTLESAAQRLSSVSRRKSLSASTAAQRRRSISRAAVLLSAKNALGVDHSHGIQGDPGSASQSSPPNAIRKLSLSMMGMNSLKDERRSSIEGKDINDDVDIDKIKIGHGSLKGISNMALMAAAGRGRKTSLQSMQSDISDANSNDLSEFGDDAASGSESLSIKIDTFEQLQEHVAEKMMSLDNVHSDEIEELDRILLDEMDAFKTMCKKELNKFSPDDEVDHHQIERLLVVQKMRMDRLKEYQQNAQDEIRKGHAKEKKKVAKVVKKRFDQYKNASESQMGKKTARQSAVIKLLGFLNGPTFNKMVEGNSMSYEPLFQIKEEEPEEEDGKKHGVKMEHPLETELVVFKTEGQLPKIQAVLGDFQFMYSYGEEQTKDGEKDSEDEDEELIKEYDKVKRQYEEQQLSKHNLSVELQEQDLDVVEEMPSKIDICWFSTKESQPENLSMRTISLADCTFNIVPPKQI